MKKQLFTAFLLLSFYLGKGQTVLDNYIRMGLESNLYLQQEDQKLQRAHEQLRLAKGLFHPTLTFNASYTLATGGRTIDVPVGDLLNPVYGSLNELTGSQNFPTTLANASEPILPNNFHDTRFEFRQALFNTDIYFNYKAHELLISVQKAAKATYQHELKKEIRKGYYNYLQTLEVLNIYDSTETVLKELVRVNEVLVENHKATKDVVFRATFELEQLYSQIALAKRQQHLAQSYFNFLLNRNLQDTILVDLGISINDLAQTGKLETLQNKAVQHRTELRQLKYAILAQEVALDKEQYNWTPKLSLGGALGFQGFGYSFDGNQDYGLVQVNLEVPILNGKRNETKRSIAQIEVDRMNTQYEELKERLKVQVVDAYYNLEAAYSIIAAKQAAFESAKENFRIVKRKYEENLVLLVEFLDARVQFTNSQLDLVIANYDVLVKQAELTRALAL